MCSKTSNTVAIKNVHVYVYVYTHIYIYMCVCVYIYIYFFFMCVYTVKLTGEVDLGKGLVMAKRVFHCVRLTFRSGNYVLIAVETAHNKNAATCVLFYATHTKRNCYLQERTLLEVQQTIHKEKQLHSVTL